MTIPPLRVTLGPKAPDVRLASSVARSILFTLTSGGCYRTSSYEYSLFKHSFKMKAILSALLLIFGLVQESFANNPNWNKIFSLVNHVAWTTNLVVALLFSLSLHSPSYSKLYLFLSVFLKKRYYNYPNGAGPFVELNIRTWVSQTNASLCRIYPNDVVKAALHTTVHWHWINIYKYNKTKTKKLTLVFVLPILISLTLWLRWPK